MQILQQSTYPKTIHRETSLCVDRSFVCLQSDIVTNFLTHAARSIVWLRRMREHKTASAVSAHTLHAFPPHQAFFSLVVKHARFQNGDEATGHLVSAPHAPKQQSSPAVAKTLSTDDRAYQTRGPRWRCERARQAMLSVLSSEEGVHGILGRLAGI